MKDFKGRRQVRQSVAIGNNPERTRAHNRRVVLEVIRLHGHLGRSAIAEHARLTPQAVANIVDDLLDEGMLVQLGRLRSGRGQPPIQFALNPDGPVTAGVEIAADRLVAVLMDLSGRVRASLVQKLVSAEPAAVVRQVSEAVAVLCLRVGLSASAMGPALQRVARGPALSGAGTSPLGTTVSVWPLPPTEPLRAGAAALDSGPAEDRGRSNGDPGRAAAADGTIPADQSDGAAYADVSEVTAGGRAAGGASQADGPVGTGDADGAGTGDQLAADAAKLSEPLRLIGVGVVMPGPFEVEGMSSVGPETLPGWAGLDGEALFGAALGLPVRLGNDATAAAVGERLHGAGRQAGSFCYLYFGVGLGLGVIQDGRPVKGAFGNAGEIGHIRLMPRRGPGLAGPEGALERQASVHALRAALTRDGIEVAGVEDIQRLHEAGDPALSRWIDLAADYLAPAVAMLENIFDPELVVFGGALPDAVMARLIAALEPLPVTVASRPGRSHPRVVAGQTGQLTAALGAASLPLLDAVSPFLRLSGPKS